MKRLLHRRELRPDRLTGEKSLHAKPQYALGHDELELERQKLQGEILHPYTRRMIRDCGIQPGMRVLDIGSGVGDVTMLLAEAVGPCGAVVGIDRGEAAVRVASIRLKKRFAAVAFRRS
jgi:ubiquinone/menaquinone biosynthesis C-methylase UbiE